MDITAPISMNVNLKVMQLSQNTTVTAMLTVQILRAVSGVNVRKAMLEMGLLAEVSARVLSY